MKSRDVQLQDCNDIELSAILFQKRSGEKRGRKCKIELQAKSQGLGIGGS